MRGRAERQTVAVMGREKFLAARIFGRVVSHGESSLWWDRHLCLSESASAGHSCPAERIRMGSEGQECPSLTHSKQARMPVPPLLSHRLGNSRAPGTAVLLRSIARHRNRRYDIRYVAGADPSGPIQPHE